MATFFLAVQTIRRAGGRSATAAAAYRAGVRIDDCRTGERHDYSRRRGVLESGLAGWGGSRAELWNAAEAAERRRDAVVAREIVVALPHEVAHRSHRATLERFARFLADRHVVAVDWAIHAPDPGGSGLNHHAHLMITSRRVSRGRLGAKTRELDVRQHSRHHIEVWRATWAQLCNEALRAAGHEARVDHRSYARQARESCTPPLRPQVKIGPAGRRLLRCGIIPAAVRTNALRALLNAEIKAIQSETARLFALIIDPRTYDERLRDRYPHERY